MTIQELLNEYRGKNAHLLLPGGNKGDGLIYMGGMALFKKYGSNVKWVGDNRPIAAKILNIGRIARKIMTNIKKLAGP